MLISIEEQFIWMKKCITKALDDILLSNKYSEKNLVMNIHIIKTKYFIAQNKIYLGLYEDTNNELKSCLKYFKKN